MNNKYPQPVYATREGEIDGLYSVMIVNHSLKDYRFKSEFPWHLWVSIEIQEQYENKGLPTPAEAEALNNLEDRLAIILKEHCAFHYIGRTTWNGNRELVYYLDHPQLAHQALQEFIISNQATREFQYEMSEDANWEAVDFFYNYEE